MRCSSHSKITLLLYVLLVLSPFSEGILRAGETSSVVASTGFSGILVAETNWMRARVSCVNAGPPHYQCVDVQLPFTTNTERSFFESSELQGFDPSGHGWKYHMATNSFCGPVELTDAEGHDVPLRKPAINSPGAYPPFYHLWPTSMLLMRGTNAIYHGPSLPKPILGPNMIIAHFSLEDYFKLEKPGEYKLVVWPKIYKRESPTNDLCRRIDIPPVSVTVNWPGEPQK